MEILHIDELISPMGNGVTGPIRGLANNEHVVVKTYNNVQGNKCLINELVSYLIAQKLELNIPEAGICKISDKTIINDYIWGLEDFSKECFGVGFFSKYLEKGMLVTSSKMIKQSRNYEWIIPKIMLFDHLIYNSDRNMGNLLFRADKYNRKLFLIDHSHVFNLQCIWDANGLQHKISEQDYNDEQIMIGNSYLYKMFKGVMNIDLVTMGETVEYFKEKINEDFLKKVVDYIPEEWENNKSELNALSEYLIYRFNNLEKFAHIISSYQY